MKRHQEAIDALRRARRTVKCGGDGQPGCIVTEQARAAWAEDRGDEAWPWADCLGVMPSDSHEAAASALLDGLSVADVTAAEEALDG